MDEWTSCEDELPGEADADEEGRVFVWHAYQGVMLSRWDRVTENRFHSYWMPIRLTAQAWIPKTLRTPKAEDADAQGCVLVRHAHEGIRITGWHQVMYDSGIMDWRTLPAPPGNNKALR